MKVQILARKSLQYNTDFLGHPLEGWFPKNSCRVLQAKMTQGIIQQNSESE